MAYEQFGPYLAAPAGVDLSASQYLAVKLDANGNVVLAGAGEAALGILADDPKQGQQATVQVRDVAKWVAGAAFDVDTLLTPDANGRAVAATAASADTGTGAITGSKVLALALKAASAAGEIVPVLIVHAGLTA